MRRFLFTRLLRLPDFKGKWRVIQLLRQGMKPYRTTTRFGFEMELDCFEWAQLYLAQHGESEPLTMKLIQQLLRRGDTYLDIGAHVGYVTLVARQAVGSEGRVVAIEPQPYNCQHLLRNWEINNFTNLDLYVAAAGSKTDFVALPQQSQTDKSRLSLSLPMPDATQLRFRVPVRTVESVIEDLELDAIRLLKIDVEGYELEVLKGLGKALQRIENIVFEALRSNPVEQQQSELTLDWLRQQGFKLHDVKGAIWNPTHEITEGNLWAVR